MAHRPLSEIANDIHQDWAKPSPYAAPYIQAMSTLNGMSDYYGLDPATEIVARFLANASTWRGEVARTIKRELNDMLSETREERA